MPDLVTIPEAKAALRVDFNDDDALLEIYVTAASDAVLQYLKAEGYASFYDGTALTATVPGNVKAATLHWIDLMYDEDPENGDKNFNIHGYPPPRVASLLYGRRDPALA